MNKKYFDEAMKNAKNITLEISEKPIFLEWNETLKAYSIVIIRKLSAPIQEVEINLIIENDEK